MAKPKLGIEEQVDHMESKGITFHNISKEEAKEYLNANNNYFKLTSYRKNFDKYSGGINIGKYINLDFSYLKDLAIIDMRMRYLLIQMCLDVEHFSKVRLMKALEQSDDNGYDIVKEYYNNLVEKQRGFLDNEICRNKDNPYCGDLFAKYSENIPAWVFVEIIPFGRYIYFYKHCANYLSNKQMENESYLLMSIKELRNATAHNNCILNDLRPNTSKHKTNQDVTQKLNQINLSRNIRRKRISNIRIQQIATLFYTHNLLVTSEGIHNHRCDMLQELTERMLNNIAYYNDVPMILNTFYFLKEVVDKWFVRHYNVNN